MPAAGHPDHHDRGAPGGHARRAARGMPTGADRARPACGDVPPRALRDRARQTVTEARPRPATPAEPP